MTSSLSSLLLLTLLSLLTCSAAARSGRHVHRFRQQAKKQRRLSDEWLERLERYRADDDVNTASPTVNCPCDNPRPVSSTDDSGIVLGFAELSSTGEAYNWTHINTVAWATPELVCRAHCHGARALVASPSFDLTPDYHITEWVQNATIMVQQRHYDGIVFDYELPATHQEARIYVKIIQATRSAFSKHQLQVITCVAWSPDGIDGRNYPAVALARASDYLYVMDYDTQSQIISGQCIASANAPFAGMIRGFERYLQLGINSKKMILGVPWYGYRYPCLAGTKSDAQFCPIHQVPFRGVNCSDAAGVEVAYGTILGIYKNMTTTEIHQTGGIKRDEYMDAAYMNHVTENGTVYQYWFDDNKSIRDKFTWARSARLGGVGPYIFDDLDPIEFPEESKAMWSTFDAFQSVNGDVAREVTGLSRPC